MEMLSVGKKTAKKSLATVKDIWARGVKNAHIPVIVYQMGKVGSTSIYSSIADCGVQPIDQVHRMNPEHIDELVSSRADRGLHPHRPDHCARGLELYEQIVSPKRESKFISLVRNPLDRNVSAFFFNVFDRKEQYQSLSTPRLVEVFIEEYAHDVPLVWFQREPAVTLDIDVYDTSFPAERGHRTYQNGSFELLVLRTELPDAEKEDIIKQFLGLSRFQIQRRNVGKSKEYAEAYQAFKENACIPKSYLDRMLQSQYAELFYTDKEIERTYDCWS